jgi:hypothetical protein
VYIILAAYGAVLVLGVYLQQSYLCQLHENGEKARGVAGRAGLYGAAEDGCPKRRWMLIPEKE